MFKVKAQNSEEKTARINKLKNLPDPLKNSVRGEVAIVDCEL